ncbi:TM9 protein C [Tieghemostelium lacteum]|uniref:TM9 protein C n=1 Tax=Tieghemostelium lacteum TaxID=361077 RepID=A0A151Z361_TIELA|nr:TM9 protein C [Tieghemostelium lacteum]|eukprot:KYQ88388.1 TM9 protein C [Tieghemostelium lacteum]
MSKTKLKSREDLKEDFYRTVYLCHLGEMPIIVVCAYCGRSSEEKCTCGNNSMKNFGFIDYSLSETLELVDIFIEWADTSFEDRKASIQKYCYDRITQIDVPNLLEKGFPEQIFLFLVRFIIENPPLCNRFTGWLDAESTQKRMMFYFMVLRSKDKERIDIVFDRLTEDLEVFNILKPLQIFICPPSIKVFTSVLEKVGSESDPAKVKLFALNLLLVDPPTVDISPSLLSKLLAPFNKNILDFKADTIYTRFVKKVLEKVCNKDYLNHHRPPILDYNQIIFYLFYSLKQKNDTTLLDILYTHYQQDFRELLSEYLDKFEANGNVEEKIFNIFENVVLLIDKYQIPAKNQPKLDRDIYIAITETTSKKFKILDHIKNFEKYLPKFASDFRFQKHEYFLAFYYLVYKCEISSLPEIVVKYIQLILINQRKTVYAFILLDLFYKDDPQMMKYFQTLSAQDFETQDFFGFIDNIVDPIHFDMALKFEQLLAIHSRSMHSNPAFQKKYQRFFCQILERYNESGYSIQDNLDRIKANTSFIMSYFFLSINSSQHLHIGTINSAILNDEKVTEVLLNASPKSYEFIFLNLTNILSSALSTKKIRNIYEIMLVENFAALPEDIGYRIIADNYKNYALLEKLFNLYDSVEKPLSPEVIKFCEISLKLNVIRVALPIAETAILEIVKANYNTPLHNLYKDIQIKFTSQQHQNQVIYDQYLIHDHLDDFLDKCKFCIKSRYFKEFYFELPLKETISAKHITYLLELEEREYRHKKMLLINPNYDPNEGKLLDTTNNLYKLPHIILKKIIHYVYHDLILHYQFKLLLATVSKTFFQLCSSIMTNYYYEDFLNNYINIRVTKKINIHSPFSLFNNYPKYLEYKSLKYISMDMDRNEHYFYEYMESLYINITNNILSTRLLVTRNTNLKVIELELVKDITNINPEKILKLVKSSPLLERINITTALNWGGFNDCIETMVSYQHENLKVFTVYLNHVATHQPLYITAIKSNLKLKYGMTKFPKFYLRSIPNIVPFDGFEYANIRFNSSTEIASGVLSSLNQIRFSIENINQVLPIIDQVNIYSNINSISFRLYKHSDEPIQPDHVQMIFDRMNPHILMFSIYFATFLTSSKISILTQDQWPLIDRKGFIPADCFGILYNRPPLIPMEE